MRHLLCKHENKELNPQNLLTLGLWRQVPTRPAGLVSSPFRESLCLRTYNGHPASTLIATLMILQKKERVNM